MANRHGQGGTWRLQMRNVGVIWSRGRAWQSLRKRRVWVWGRTGWRGYMGGGCGGRGNLCLHQIVMVIV
eukprot:8875597-Ditylum_brightwellii.AAC.1